MDLTLTIHVERGPTMIRLFKDRQSPTSYKEFTLAIARDGNEQRHVIPARQIQDLLNKIRDAKISPFAEGDLGLDGTAYELLFEDGLSSVAYKWWMSPGAGWEALAEIAHAVLGLAQRHSHEYLP